MRAILIVLDSVGIGHAPDARDYGDEGVVEYVISELVRCFHGFGKTVDGGQAQPSRLSTCSKT